VVGKFLAAWLFTALALALTFPLWLTVNYPAIGYPRDPRRLPGSPLLAWGSGHRLVHVALTRNQAYPSPGGGCVLCVCSLASAGVDLSARPAGAHRRGRLASFLTHFESIAKGVIDLRDLLYFAMLIGFFLLATAIALELRKAD
jgi:ABC-2 type transport system permease protein